MTDFNKDAFLVLPDAANQEYPLAVPGSASLDDVIVQLNRFSALMGAIAPNVRFPELVIAEALRDLKIFNISFGDTLPSTGARGDLFILTGNATDVARPFIHNGTGFTEDTTVLSALFAPVAPAIQTLAIV